MQIKKISKNDLQNNYNVLLRVDFNVPIKAGKIVNDFKIKRILPTIDFLLNNCKKIVLMTHLDASKNKLITTKPLANYLTDILGQKVLYIDKLLGSEVKNKISKCQEKIVILENVRSHPGEEANDRGFASEISKLGDIYINDAFGVSHRRHATLSAIKRFLPSFAGFLVTDEILNLNKILKPKKPLVAILGGAKISTKLPLIKKFAINADYILVGGGIANNFFAAQNLSVNSSLIENDMIKEAGNIFSKKIILPIDVVSAKNEKSKIIDVCKPDCLKRNFSIFDIGPKSITLFSSYIKRASTIIWNGPLGLFENEKFKHGSLSISRSIASRSKGSAFAVIGGGETIEAASMAKMLNYIDWVSTGGGAMLSYLSGEEMPGLDGLINNK